MFIRPPLKLTGVGFVDEEHEQIARLAQEFAEAVFSKRMASVLSHKLNEIEGVVRGHFEAEEVLIADYPQYREHKRMHEWLLSDIAKLRWKYDHYRDVPIDVANFMRDWIVHHVNKGDMQWAQWLANLKSEKSDTSDFTSLT